MTYPEREECFDYKKHAWKETGVGDDYCSQVSCVGIERIQEIHDREIHGHGRSGGHKKLTDKRF